MADGICTIDGCGRRAGRARGWCVRHYKRWQRHGDPLAGDPPRSVVPAPCSIEGCGRIAHARGWCTKHHSRWRRHGDPLALMQAPHGAGTITSSGYRLVYAPDGRKVVEHRLVMEQVIGRPLRPDENVHHLNGVRLDNRPENLELWVTHQPQGQRVDDVVPWAVEILRRYAQDLLA